MSKIGMRKKYTKHNIEDAISKVTYFRRSICDNFMMIWFAQILCSRLLDSCLNIHTSSHDVHRKTNKMQMFRLPRFSLISPFEWHIDQCKVSWCSTMLDAHIWFDLIWFLPRSVDLIGLPQNYNFLFWKMGIDDKNMVVKNAMLTRRDAINKSVESSVEFCGTMEIIAREKLLYRELTMFRIL